jgi:hypothetical protein
MASLAVGLFVRFKSLLTVVAGPAILAFIYLSHGDLCLFLHREDLWMAVCALQSLVPMDFPIKDNLAADPSFVIYRLPGRNSKATPCKHNRHDES